MGVHMQSHQPQLELANTDPPSAIAEFEQILVSNSGEDPFDSAIKLLAAKLLDEVEEVSGHAPKFHIQKTASATALRLAKVFGTSVQIWMGLRDEYELREARSAIKDQLEHMMPIARREKKATNWLAVGERCVVYK